MTGGLRRPDDETSWRRMIVPLLTVWIILLVFSFWHAPVPGVNEPHYLTKGRHYWDAQWCAGDFFLESSNPHLVFYLTFGGLAAVLPFGAAAVIGRLIGYLVLAVGWQLLATRCTTDRWSSVTAVTVFLLLAAIGNLSGEWMVAGIEGKVPAWGCVLAGLAMAMSHRWIATGCLLGIAVMFHPLVGAWSVVALSMSGGLRVLRLWRQRSPGTALTTAKSWLCRRDVIIGVVALGFVSLPGLIPALRVVGAASEKQEFAANWLQVFYRLKHHLDPMTFHSVAWVGYGVMGSVCLMLARVLRASSEVDEVTSPSEPRTGTAGGGLVTASFTEGAGLLGTFVGCSAIIAACGLAVAWGERPWPQPVSQIPLFELRMKLLKFYPFRLLDVALPVLLSLQVAGLFSRRRLLVVLLPAWLPRTGLAITLIAALWLGGGRGSISQFTSRQQDDWRIACEWIRDNTDVSSLFLTPAGTRTFKWYAERPEYVIQKDCPQDAAGIVEWNRRLLLLRKWGEENYSRTGYSTAATRRLHDETGITHIVSRRLGPFAAPIVYRNETYRVYDIRPVGRGATD